MAIDPRKSRKKSVTQADIRRAISTATACGLVIRRIVLKPREVELICADIDATAESPKDEGAKPKQW